VLYEKPTYYIILKQRTKGYEIMYNIGNESYVTTVLRLNGKNADKIFKNIIEALAIRGATVPVRVSDYEQVYSIREDLGPIVGAYLILVRRAKNIEKWSKFFEALLAGYYVGVAKAFASFLELAIELSKSMQRTSTKKRYELSPIVVNALSTALKQFVNKIIRGFQTQAR